MGLQSLQFVFEVGLLQLALAGLGQEAIETLLGNRTLSYLGVTSVVKKRIFRFLARIF